MTQEETEGGRNAIADRQSPGSDHGLYGDCFTESRHGEFKPTDIAGSIRNKFGTAGGGSETLIVAAFNQMDHSGGFRQSDIAASLTANGSSCNGGGETLIVDIPGQDRTADGEPTRKLHGAGRTERYAYCIGNGQVDQLPEGGGVNG